MKGKVLVIEDNPDWQNDLREFLEEAGFYVEVVATLQEAIKKVEKEMFHFITIDLQLDESNADVHNWEGWEVLDMVNKLRINDITPTMVITAHSKEYKAIKEIKKLEGICFMAKAEFDKRRFISEIEGLVNRIDLRFNNDHREV